MGLFNDSAEIERKKKLEQLEDKRLRFLDTLNARSFRPERMLLGARDDSGLIAVSREGGKLQLVLGPAFGGDGEYRLMEFEQIEWRREDHFVASEGLGGIFGMGRRAEQGFRISFILGEESVVLPIVSGVNSALFCASTKKNPLLNPKRRAGNANVVWDLPPIDRNGLKKLEGELYALLEPSQK